MSWIRRILVTYMVATTMHLPIPVFDGDNLKSGEAHSAAALSTDDDYDVDFVLLGCDPPDDSDDGPVDDDPEDGSQSVFGPSFLASKADGRHVSCPTERVQHPDSCSIAAVILVNGPLRPAQAGLPRFSFGKLCQSGTANLRC